MSMKAKILTGILNLVKFPILKGKPKMGKWYGIPLEGCVSADGVPAHAAFRKGSENKLIVLFFGGGVSWNEYMAARPNSIFGNPDKINFYAVGDGGLVADLATRIGIPTLSKNKSNPFHTWNMLAIPYVTGDFHCGTGDFPYTALDGTKKILHHHGYTNYRKALTEAIKHIGNNPEQILVTGFSAGGWGTALLTDDVMRTFPNCKNVTSYVDSSLMLHPDWRGIAENVWKAPKEIADRLQSENNVLDCLRALKKDHGDRVKIAYSCSVRDCALAEFVNYIQEDKLYADKESGIKFQEQLKQMCDELQQAIPNVSLFIFDTLEENAEKKAMGLTKHCVGKAEKLVVEGTTAAQWLWDTVCDNPRQIGLALLDQSPNFDLGESK